VNTQVLRIASIVCATLIFASQAVGQVKSEVWSDAELNRFIEFRWLAGSSSDMFKLQTEKWVDQLFYAIEQQRGKPFPKEAARQLKLQLENITNSAQKTMPTEVQLQEQYGSWRGCIANGYKSKLHPETQIKIYGYYKQGVFENFTKFQKQIESWFGEAMGRARRDGQKLFDQVTLDRLQKDTAFQQRFKEMFGAFLVLDTAFPKLQAVQNQFGTQAYMAVASELNMSALSLPSVAKHIGISDEQFAALVSYANLDSADAEFKVFDVCISAGISSDGKVNQQTPYLIWTQDIVKNLMQFAQSNEALFK
jgi:hypothetical protein